MWGKIRRKKYVTWCYINCCFYFCFTPTILKRYETSNGPTEKVMMTRLEYGVRKHGEFIWHENCKKILKRVPSDKLSISVVRPIFSCQCFGDSTFVTYSNSNFAILGQVTMSRLLASLEIVISKSCSTYSKKHMKDRSYACHWNLCISHWRSK